MMKNIFLSLMVVCATSCIADTGDLFEAESPSSESRQIKDWIVDSGNNSGLPFIILDKKRAKVFVFKADGQLRGAAPALIGSAIGDYSVPGIGERKLSAILAQERTTPAGRFVVSLGRNLQNKTILWVDYDAAISLHAVITDNPKERRAERLATLTPLDNRISYGCINVPTEFFKNVIRPTFLGTNGIAYILPEIRPVLKYFGAYNAKKASQ